MKRVILHIAILLSISGTLWSQEDGVVSFNLPVRNSLTFNRFLLNPTFSVVREQNKIFSFTNKREWVQFEDSPSSYIFSYSGRLNERSGFGAALFQQNFGVLSNYGGVLNYAYNVPISNDNNLSFGANLGVYQSGINSGNVVTNIPDPSLNTIPSNFLMTFNPSINYGTRFLDFGLSLNNFTLYNFTTSSLVEDDPEKAIQAHLMYTGFIQNSGFFDDSKFSALVRSDFRESDVVISGLMMLTIPKGIWGQAGYSTLNGVSVGLGVNVFKGVALEYNYEKGLGDLVDFGSAHEFTLAYRLPPSSRNRYEDDVEMASIIPEKRRKTKVNKTDEATRERIAARVQARKLEQSNPTQVVASAAVAENTKSENIDPKNDVVVNKESTKDTISKTEDVAAREAEANKKRIAKQRAEEQERLARLKATEDERRRAAMAALAAAEAEENKEKAEPKRLEEERIAKQEAEAKRLEQERLEQQRLAQEQARLKAEQEAEAKRLADLEAQEAQRKAALAAAEKEAEAKRLEQERLDQQRLAQEQAKLKAEQEAEAKRLAALAAAEKEAEAKRLEQERLEQQRVAQEEARLKAEQEAEAKRLADLEAQETQRKAALAAAEKEAEAKRLEQQRLAQEEARLKAQQQAEAEALKVAAIAAAAKSESASENQESTEVPVKLNIDDRQAKRIQNVTEASNELRTKQEALLADLQETVDSRKQDLNDLREENDLSEKGIYKAPKPFKSISEENAKLESLTKELDKVIEEQDKRIAQLQDLMDKRKDAFPSDDEMNMIYLDEILILQKSQKETKEAKRVLMMELSEIKLATEVERKRRIKRAAYDNQEDRYAKDMAELKRLKETTKVNTLANTDVDYDFGDSRGGTIKILKDVKNVEQGFYLVMAVHSDKAKRDEFLRAAIASGVDDVEFFYDVSTSKYYIYSKKFSDINEANRAMASSGSSGYDEQMSMIKIENKSMK